jgi:hypothetical protein
MREEKNKMKNPYRNTDSMSKYHLWELKWTYRGRFLVFATCPSCKCSMSVSENKIELPLQLVELDRHRQVEAASVGGAKARG